MTGGAAFNEVFLNDVWISDDDRLDDVGNGWAVALTTLSNERSAIGAEAFGGHGIFRLERYRSMVRHFGLADDRLVRQKLADLYIHLEVAKQTRRRASDMQRAGHAPGPEAALGKLALSDNIRRLSSFVSDVLGARLTANTGEWGTFAWQDVVVGAPGYRLGGGTDEILKNILGERVLGLGKEPEHRPADPSPR
jgi:alkylation response protein AidB-like acyl-CoA dehydrogenase